MRGDINVTNNYQGGSSTPLVTPSPLAGITVGTSGVIPQEPDHYIARDQVGELDAGLSGQRIAVVVTGMRGAGKTHLAAAYARRILDRREGMVAWINAETPKPSTPAWPNSPTASKSLHPMGTATPRRVCCGTICPPVMAGICWCSTTPPTSTCCVR
ncbi:hypothetical protein ACIG56_33355 [Nocardia fusca]|uniref:hypothetical protein n=1 Tax=Nocardia fusca TaxID=941183 RepID=UPI0037CAC320